MEKNSESKVITLKVGAQTDLSDLKTSTFEHLRSEGKVYLDAIGADAAYNALRAIIFTQRQMPENVEIQWKAGMVVVDTPHGERKAVRFTCAV